MKVEKFVVVGKREFTNHDGEQRTIGGWIADGTTLTDPFNIKYLNNERLAMYPGNESKILQWYSRASAVAYMQTLITAIKGSGRAHLLPTMEFWIERKYFDKIEDDTQ